MTKSIEIAPLEANGSIDYCHLFTDPHRVVRDPTLSLDEKRSLLASWASDARAVPNNPALRRLDNGCLVEIDDVLDALKRLDGLSTFSIPKAAKWSYRRGHWSRLGRQWRRGRDDDDDDDPSTPAPAAPWPRPPKLEGSLAAAA